MDRHGDQPEGSWPLAARVAACLMAIYRDTFGSVEPLFIELEIGVAHGVPPAERVGALSVDHLARLTGRAAARLAGEDNLSSGRSPLRRTDWRVILYSLSTARTLRQAIERCGECFEAIDWRCGRMSLRTRTDCAELQLDSLRLHGSSAAGCLVDLVGLTQIHGLLEWLIGRAIPVRHIWLDHPEDLFRSLDLPPLPFPLRLAAGWTGFDFSPALLDHPVVRTADELAARPPQSLLFAASGQDGPDPGASGQVRRIALRSLREGHRLPRFAEIAVMMTGSEATLRRRLAQEGTGYRQIRESCRRELALDLLRRTDLPIEEIAARLDYCDSDAFRQAFRDWLDMSPSAYRQEAAGGV